MASKKKAQTKQTEQVEHEDLPWDELVERTHEEARRQREEELKRAKWMYI